LRWELSYFRAANPRNQVKIVPGLMIWQQFRRSAGLGASQGRANSFCNFTLVAAATPKIQNVLVRSCVVNAAGDDGGGRDRRRGIPR
jgi:hypothetical protein